MSKFQTCYGGEPCFCCNKKIDLFEQGYIIPTNKLYSSKKYKQSFLLAAIMVGVTADQYISQMKSLDDATNHVVCKNCVSMFK